MPGTRYEQNLAKRLHKNGFAVMRAPTSGGGTKRDLPDILYGKRGEKPVALELKTTSEDIAYYNEGEVAALDRFADAFGAHARLCVRFKGDTSFYEVKPLAARRTDSGTYAVESDTDVVRVHKP